MSKETQTADDILSHMTFFFEVGGELTEKNAAVMLEKLRSAMGQTPKYYELDGLLEMMAYGLVGPHAGRQLTQQIIDTLGVEQTPNQGFGSGDTQARC